MLPGGMGKRVDDFDAREESTPASLLDGIDFKIIKASKKREK